MNAYVWTACIMYGINGLSTVILGVVMPSLLAYYASSYATGGQMILLQFIGFLAGVAVSSILVRRIGHKAMLVLGSLCIAVGTIGIGILPSLPVVAAMCFLNGSGLSITQTTVASAIMEWFEGSRAVIMSRLEVAFGVGALVMPLVGSLLIADHSWSLGFLMVGFLSLLFSFVWLLVPLHPEKKTEQEYMDAPSLAFRTSGRGARTFSLVLFLTMIFLYVGIESCLNGFLPSMFILHLGQPESSASFAIAIFWTSMVIGRTLTGWVIRKIPYASFLLWSIGATLVFLMGLTVWRNVIFGYCVIFLIGLSMSGIFAITMVFANHAFPGQARVVTGLVTAFAGLGGAALPALLGWLMDFLPIIQVFWSIAGFTFLLLMSLIALLLLDFTGRRSTKTYPHSI
jgi:MFS transporter, FHS family, glucose/mannose:H+ symporter